MRHDEVAERGGEASSSKNWNAERKEVATWSCRSDTEGVAEVDIWHRSNKHAPAETDFVLGE